MKKLARGRFVGLTSKIMIVGIIATLVGTSSLAYGLLSNQVIISNSGIFGTTNMGDSRYVISTDGTYTWASNSTNPRLWPSTNPSAVINNAMTHLTSGRTWKEKVILSGDFALSSTIKVPSYAILEIRGRLRAADGSQINAIVNSDTSGGNVQIDIEGGEIDGNKAGNTNAGNDALQNGIRLINVSNMTIKNMYIHDVWQSCIQCYPASDITIENNTLMNTGARHGICLYNNCYRDNITKNIIKNCVGYGVWMQNVYDTKIDNNWVENTNDAYGTLHCLDLVFRGNTAYNNFVGDVNRVGFDICHTSNSSLYGNTAEANCRGFAFEGDCHDITVVENTAKGNIPYDDHYGVGFFSCTYDGYTPQRISWINNTVIGAGIDVVNTYAIYLSTAVSNVVQGNNISEIFTGIFLYAGSSYNQIIANGFHDIHRSGGGYDIIIGSADCISNGVYNNHICTEIVDYGTNTVIESNYY